MLPFLTAAGHNKYKRQSAPLHLHEMSLHPETAPGVQQAFEGSAFVSHSVIGHHNGVSPDMVLE